MAKGKEKLKIAEKSLKKALREEKTYYASPVERQAYESNRVINAVESAKFAVKQAQDSLTEEERRHAMTYAGKVRK